MLVCRCIRRNAPPALFCLLAFFLFPLLVSASESDTHFPYFDAIRDNVVFWENVYGKYSENTAILHDRDDLSIVYAVTPLLDPNLPGADRINSKYLKIFKKKHADILKKLAQGKEPVSREEQHILSLFSPPDLHKKLDRAADNLRIQTGLKERFVEGVIRSGAYMTEMKKILSSYGLPEDLAYLPHVESSFNPKAYSRHGAAGIWQFTRSTGKRYMAVNYILDERLDPLTSTHGAAQYLKHNFENLDSWPLAITAYNYGHAGMLRAKVKMGSYEDIFNNYREGHFKFASRNFYAEFLAARNIAKKIEKSASIKRHSPQKRVYLKLKGYAAAADISKYFNLSDTDLQELNPSLRHTVWQGEKYIPKGYSLRLPHTQENANLAQNLPNDLLKNKQKRSHYYKVRPGDTAGGIAHRFNISLRSLSSANNLNRRAMVYIGQTLRIPPARSAQERIRKDNREALNSADDKKSGIPILKEKRKAAAG